MNYKKLSLALVVMLGYVGFTYSISYKKALSNFNKVVAKEIGATNALKKAYIDYRKALGKRTDMTGAVYKSTLDKRHKRIRTKFKEKGNEILNALKEAYREGVPVVVVPEPVPEWDPAWDKPDWYDKPMGNVGQLKLAMTDESTGWLDVAIEEYKDLLPRDATDQQKAEAKRLVNIMRKAKILADVVTQGAIQGDIDAIERLYT